jgi:hypothetical protein
MFFLLGLIAAAGGAVPLFITFKNRKQFEQKTFQRRIKKNTAFLAAVIAGLVLLNVFFQYYTVYYWFRELGYSDRFWTVFAAAVILFCIGALISFIALFFPLKAVERRTAGGLYRDTFPLAGAVLGGVIFGGWLSGMWEPALLFLNGGTGPITDPVFDMSIGFYLFRLPFFSSLVTWFIALSVALSGGILFLQINSFTNGQETGSGNAGERRVFDRYRWIRPLFFSVGGLLIFIALEFVLGIYRLLYSQTGVVTGAGWVDIHVRQPVYIISAVLVGLLGIMVLISGFSRNAFKGLTRAKDVEGTLHLSGKAVVLPVTAAVILIIGNWLLPSLIQSTVVGPNEVAMEEPYIKHNIAFTRQAYSLTEETVQERSYEVGRRVTPEVVQENRSTLNNIRLWDWRALRDNLKQQQEIRLYYSFYDVDVDRYMINGEYRQMMLSVRELDKDSLAEKSKTWVSQHLIYTHGYGVVMTPVHEIKGEGRPKLIIKNIPPEEDIPELELTRPQIYYGETTNDHVYVDTGRREFDYPSGTENVYTTYEGRGGVPLDGFLKRFIYAWKFDGYRQLFSSYINGDSQIMYHRHVKERINNIAPFIRLDRDPYPVITADGRIVYIVDGYTTSSRYPYSEIYSGGIAPFSMLNYIRNSVKITVDAYHGDVNFYVIDEDDLILGAYRKIFPDLFKPFSDMPENLQRHIRYPVDYLTIQADIYATYHMTDVDVFYQREDVWQFATERYRENFQPVTPYYTMVQFPGQDEIEFVLILPFTPKGKNVMNGWFAGRSDIPDYGKIRVYPIPKGVEVLGPRQIEARVDQNTEMSRALSLWSQRGSEVIRGNLLAIPLFLENTLFILFVEPIFLQAEDAQLPELKRIVAADQTTVVWADTFDAAVKALLERKIPETAGVVTQVEDGAAPEEEEAPDEPAPAPSGPAPAYSEIARQAAQVFDSYLENLRRGDLEEAGADLDELGTILSRVGQ